MLLGTEKNNEQDLKLCWWAKSTAAANIHFLSPHVTAAFICSHTKPNRAGFPVLIELALHF
jgi:hypothetical protein